MFLKENIKEKLYGYNMIMLLIYRIKWDTLAFIKKSRTFMAARKAARKKN